jgi:hypothetical protein
MPLGLGRASWGLTVSGKVSDSTCQVVGGGIRIDESKILLIYHGIGRPEVWFTCADGGLPLMRRIPCCFSDGVTVCLQCAVLMYAVSLRP